MVPSGFRDAGKDIPDPPPVQSAPDSHNEENMDARPDAEEIMEIEQATNKFLQLLEKQEKRASRTWPPYCYSCPSLSLHTCPLALYLWQRPEAMEGHWRLVFSQHLTKIRQICSPSGPSQSCAFTNTLRTTGY